MNPTKDLEKRVEDLENFNMSLFITYQSLTHKYFNTRLKKKGTKK